MSWVVGSICLWTSFGHMRSLVLAAVLYAITATVRHRYLLPLQPALRVFIRYACRTPLAFYLRCAFLPFLRASPHFLYLPFTHITLRYRRFFITYARILPGVSLCGCYYRLPTAYHFPYTCWLLYRHFCRAALRYYLLYHCYLHTVQRRSFALPFFALPAFPPLPTHLPCLPAVLAIYTFCITTAFYFLLLLVYVLVTSRASYLFFCLRVLRARCNNAASLRARVLRAHISCIRRAALRRRLPLPVHRNTAPHFAATAVLPRVARALFLSPHAFSCARPPYLWLIFLARCLFDWFIMYVYRAFMHLTCDFLWFWTFGFWLDPTPMGLYSVYP